MADINDSAQEQNLDPTTSQDNVAGAETDNDQQNHQMSAQEYEDKLQELLNENARLKRANTKATGEASKYKKQYQETLSAQELASQQKAEEAAAQAEELERLRRNERKNELVQKYMDRGYTSDLAKKIADAELDNDTDKRFEIMSQHDAAQKKAWEQEWMKNRPEVRTGTGDGPTVTQEQFNAMGLQERTALMRKDPALYSRLMGRK